MLVRSDLPNTGFINREQLIDGGVHAERGARASIFASIYNCDNLYLGRHCRIDDFVVINAGDNIWIGPYVHISSHCKLQGGMIGIGAGVAISAGVMIIATTDDYSGEHLTGPTIPEEYRKSGAAPVHIGDNVIIGVNSVLLPGADIGEGCAIGANSLVKGKLEPYGIYVGTPVRRIKERSRVCKTLLEKLLQS